MYGAGLFVGDPQERSETPAALISVDLHKTPKKGLKPASRRQSDPDPAAPPQLLHRKLIAKPYKLATTFRA